MIKDKILLYFSGPVGCKGMFGGESGERSVVPFRDFHQGETIGCHW